MKKLTHGFTLVEVMITLTVAIIVLAVGIPAFNSMLANNRATAQTNDIVTALHLARSEAVRLGTQVVVCAGNGSAATPAPTACSGANDWSAGLLVAVNSGGNAGNWVPPPNDIRRVWDRFTGNVTIGEKVNGASQIAYLADGGVVDLGCLQMDHSKATGAHTQRWLAISEIGRIQTTSTYAEAQPTCP